MNSISRNDPQGEHDSVKAVFKIFIRALFVISNKQMLNRELVKFIKLKY